MTFEQKMKNLSVPKGLIDVVLDTDAYNEIDDQFAIAYMLRSKDKLNVKAIYAAPFFNGKSSGPLDGMEKSYNEILKLQDLMGEKIPTYKGSGAYLPDEQTPVISEAAQDLARRVNEYSPENPLYIVAIGAITNIASAMLINPAVAENSVIVWLGGHATHFHDTAEFNMVQDVAAARMIMGSNVPFVQLPCIGVVSTFTISKPELVYWFKGKNAISDYLAENTINEADSYALGKPWTRVVWDVTAVAWLLNDDDRFMLSRIIPTIIPTYENQYIESTDGGFMRYVYQIDRDRLWADVIEKITR